MQRKKAVFIGFILIFAGCSASSERVALVVDFPSGEDYTKCIPVSDGTNGYDVLEYSKLDIDWSYFPSFGHGLCGIDSIGCPSTNCFCSPTDYWNFYTSDNGVDWSYSQLGFDGGSSCSEHYCAVDSTFMGLGYGPYGTTPGPYALNDVCCLIAGDQAPCGEINIREVIDYIEAWMDDRASLIDVVDLITAWAQD